MLHPHRRPAGLAQIADTLSQPATTGRLAQVIDRWIYTACLCFGLDRTWPSSNAAGSPTAIGLSGRVQPQPHVHHRRPDGPRVRPDRRPDRTRSRLDVPILRTLFGAKQRPGRNGTPDLSLKLNRRLVCGARGARVGDLASRRGIDRLGS